MTPTTRSSTSGSRSTTAFPNVYGSHFRRVTLTDDARRRAARQGRDPDGDVAHRSHVAGRARQVGAGQPARTRRRRRCRPTCRRSTRARQQAGRVLTMRERMEEHRRESGVRQLPQDHGSDRAGDGELRRRRRVADARRRHATARPIDASGELLDGTKVDGVVSLRQGADAQAGDLRRDGRREADDLCAGPRRRGHTTCRRCGRSCATRRSQNYRFSSIVEGIVNSTPFQMRIKVPQDIEQPSGCGR